MIGNRTTEPRRPQVASRKAQVGRCHPMEFQIECVACGHAASVSAERLEAEVGEPVKINTINQVYARLTCMECGEGPVRVLDDRDRLIIDPEHLVECHKCRCPVEELRLAVQPKTNICAACMIGAVDAERKPPGVHIPDPIQLDDQRIRKVNKTCTRCGKKTVLRQNKRTLKRFLGCIGFPYCRWTRSV
jgi:hypothetical protein